MVERDRPHVGPNRNAPVDKSAIDLLPDNADPNIVSPHPTITRLTDDDPEKPLLHLEFSQIRNPLQIAKDIAHTALRRLLKRIT